MGLSHLAATTQLTPSEVREVMARLANKHLAELKEGWGQLTDDGLYVCDLLRQQARKPPQLPTYPRVIVVPDQSAAQQVIETRSEAELDRALDAELEKLKGRQ